MGKKVGGVKTLVGLGSRKNLVGFYPTNLCWMTVLLIEAIKLENLDNSSKKTWSHKREKKGSLQKIEFVNTF